MKYDNPNRSRRRRRSSQICVGAPMKTDGMAHTFSTVTPAPAHPIDQRLGVATTSIGDDERGEHAELERVEPFRGGRAQHSEFRIDRRGASIRRLVGLPV